MFHKLKLTTLNPDFFSLSFILFLKTETYSCCSVSSIFTELLSTTLYVILFIILLETYTEKNLLCFYYEHLIHSLKLKFNVNEICTGNCLYKNGKHVK